MGPRGVSRGAARSRPARLGLAHGCVAVLVDFDDAVELTRHLARVLGRVLLREPEQVHVNVFGLWARS